MKKYIIAKLEYISEDDGMILVYTGTINGNGKNIVMAINEKLVIDRIDDVDGGPR